MPATPEGTEANALYGTPRRDLRDARSAASAGVEYIILTMLGGKEQLRRFAREVMPAFPADRVKRRIERCHPSETIAASWPLASATFP